MCKVDCKHCNIFFEDGFPIPSIGPDTDQTYWAPHGGRYNANFTKEHAEAFNRFEKNMNEWGFTPEAPTKVKLEDNSDLLNFIDGHDFDTAKMVLRREKARL